MMMLLYTINGNILQNTLLLFRDFGNSAWALKPYPLLGLEAEYMETT